MWNVVVQAQRKPEDTNPRRYTRALCNLLLYSSRYLKHHVLEFYGVNVDRWGVRAGVLAIQITDSVKRV